ncbi:hypothetical protein AVEN_106920-1 [Araneus ventricosus]|uniref:Uncharacterized protein n=1 Tax=Araneus ventricosus TaxID=182803 RepID=A0A4Y2NQA5_ARAVE|nr:hypothetical protein AVEN_106920-1 [Araneus ventricosus]
MEHISATTLYHRLKHDVLLRIITLRLDLDVRPLLLGGGVWIRTNVWCKVNINYFDVSHKTNTIKFPDVPSECKHLLWNIISAPALYQSTETYDVLLNYGNCAWVDVRPLLLGVSLD